MFAGAADILVYFYELGLRLMKYNGSFSFITSNKFMRANYGKALRDFLWQFNLSDIIDFGELPVFAEAATFPVIVNLSKATNDNRVNFTQIKTLKFDSLQEVLKQSATVLDETAFSSENWTLADNVSVKLIEKLKTGSISLKSYLNGEINYGIKTGFNKAFIINEAKRAELIKADSKSAEIILPFVIGDDIRRYTIKNGEPKFIIFTRRGIDIEQYPAIKNHLLQFKTQLEPLGLKDLDTKKNLTRKIGTYKWFEIQDTVAYFEDFTKPKIIYPVIAKESRFTFAENTLFANDKTFIIPNSDFYLLAYLNSKLAWFYLKNICSVLGDADKGGRLELRAVHVQTLPIKKISPEAQAPFIKLVDEILRLKKQGEGTTEQENKIDEMVYDLYELTEDEKRIVKGKVE